MYEWSESAAQVEYVPLVSVAEMCRPHLQIDCLETLRARFSTSSLLAFRPTTELFTFCRRYLSSSLKLNESIIFHFPPWLTPECLSYTLSLTRAQLREFCQGGACVHALIIIWFSIHVPEVSSCFLRRWRVPRTHFTTTHRNHSTETGNDFCSLGQFITLSGFTPR